MTSRPFCDDCPDREGCMQGIPCGLVRKLHGSPALAVVLEGFNPKRLISANKRIHHYTRAEVTAYWRKLAANAVREQYGTADHGCAWYEQARLVITFRYPDRKRRDVGNLYPYVAKALVDGCVDARLLPDDNDRHLIGPDLRRDPDKGPHRITIHIEPWQGAT